MPILNFNSNTVMIFKRLLWWKKTTSTPVVDSGWNGSANYWQNRYVSGDNSGAGSYNRLAEFKAEILNSFVKDNDVKSIIEWGCGDGNQLSLAQYPSYLGYDVALKAIEICKERFINDASKKFEWCGHENFSTKARADLSMSLDVIYHLIEDNVYETYMRQLFDTSRKFVCIYSCNDDNPSIGCHVKHRIFTDWIDKNVSDNWELFKTVKNRYPYDENNPDNTSWSDFYFFVKK